MGQRDEIIAMLEQTIDNATKSEDYARSALEGVRARHDQTKVTCAGLVENIGFTPALMDLVSASARLLAASEAEFGHTVEYREALAKLRAEIASAK